jgi:transitional endoplasmic reticulum ATPase
MEESGSSRVVVIGITNRPDLLDHSLLRPGRLEPVLYVQQPDEKGRQEIINILTEKMPLASDVNLEEIAVSTQNYTGADLAALCREAGVHAMQNNASKVGSVDFSTALKKVRPSITKEVDQWYSAIRETISNVVPKAIDKTFYG